MGRVRGDPITTALAHPTRRAAYVALAQSEEMSTVQLQERLGVDRYNLYHHLKKLASLELIENHRDRAELAGGERTSTLTCPNCSTQHRHLQPPLHPLQHLLAPQRPSHHWRLTKKAGMSSSLTSKVHETKSAQSN